MIRQFFDLREYLKDDQILLRGVPAAQIGCDPARFIDGADKGNVFFDLCLEPAVFASAEMLAKPFGQFDHSACDGHGRFFKALKLTVQGLGKRGEAGKTRFPLILHIEDPELDDLQLHNGRVGDRARRFIQPLFDPRVGGFDVRLKQLQLMRQKKLMRQSADFGRPALRLRFFLPAET